MFGELKNYELTTGYAGEIYLNCFRGDCGWYKDLESGMLLGIIAEAIAHEGSHR